MEYLKTVPFTGNKARALDVAQSTFASQGFQIVASSEVELRVTGPGLNSTRENPLRGVSEASVFIRASVIEVKALLGGVRKMKTFLRLFPLGMLLLFMVVFGVLAWRLPPFRQWWIFLIPVLALSPWLVLAPLISRSIGKKTVQAMDTLLNNMIMVGKDGL